MTGTPYDHEALWMKAKLFINRAMDDDEARAFDEKSLWAALALELLAKAALARVSPLLIAEPTEDGSNLLIASQLIKGDARFTSVRSWTLFIRCQKAFKPFSQAEATAITNARNEYLHSSGVGFTAIPQSVWWPKFWAQATILIGALDKEIEDFVGLDRSGIVERHLEQNSRNVENRTIALIERAKQRLHQHREGTLPAKVAAEFKPGSDNGADLRFRALETCPACGSDGWLEGEEIDDTHIEYSNDTEHSVPEAFVTHTIQAEFFSCPTCQLRLDGIELIEQAGLPSTFDVDGDPSDLYDEGDYGND
ncbi:hypothetical protein [Amycolatopsis sp. FDAARGOS 1241]|uniref:hypothetical protein n=1 Tax=Amycolatopsis sp. FDAARGOS 1241 TaxID=2778070 RepID=UPI0019508DDA|nr:hypothetical protein [Amycolatopsis sp. FDAARGOS 1241]QRP47406.1 hypothetical protein I6J71_05400 [Amycolatopsis sp. FDAARGOS 1241]